MKVYGMTHGDALVILKNKKADRKDTVKALDLLLTFNDLSELKNLEKKELRRLIEFVTEQKMSWERFNSTTKEELEAIVKDFQIETIKRRNARKKVE